MNTPASRGEPGLPLPHGVILMLGWLVPGAAHWLIRRRLQAVTVFVIIHFMFLYGLFLGSALYRYNPKNPLPSLLEKAAQMGAGGVYWLGVWTAPQLRDWPEGRLKAFGRRFNFGRGDHRHAWAEKGTTFTFSAGLLNILMVLKVHDVLMHAAALAEEEPDEKKGREVSSDETSSAEDA